MHFKNFWKKNSKRFIIAWIFVMLMVAIAVGYNIKQKDMQMKSISYIEFNKMISEESIDYVEYSPDGDEMVVKLLDGSIYRTSYPAYEEFKKDMLDKGVNIKKKSGLPDNAIFTIIEACIAVIYIGLIIFMTKGVGNVRAKDIIQKSDVKFDQVIGLDEIMDDISLYVSLIKNPEVGDEIGAKMPKGVLLSGEPGTGKTLIAKAIAGEAGVPFISMSGSEFVELYKGAGARRVRKLFKLARKNAPCVIFIDEIDAIGGKRNSRGTDSEDTQTIDQLLKEMDGFTNIKGVFILAATNCPENLDEALKRSGRFDRQVNIMPPKDWKVRKQLLDLYLKDYQVDDELNTELVAKAIAGFTGADIASICNEAGLVAISKGIKKVDRNCIEEAIDKKVFSGNRAKREQFEKDREIVAYHEAGHAVMKYLLGQPISRASIVGTTSGVGGAVFGEEKDGLLRTSKDIRDSILVCYAGRVAENLKFGDFSTGATNDISKATELIIAYITQYGFDENVGPICYNTLSQRKIEKSDISTRISDMGKNCEKQANEQMKNSFELVERLALELLDKEILTGSEIESILQS